MGWAMDFTAEESGVQHPANESQTMRELREAQEQADNPDVVMEEQNRGESKPREEWLKEVNEVAEQQLLELEKEGGMIYELYSVMVHRGTADSGHYFAYIKDTATDQWYKFNDSQVLKVDLLEVLTAFGRQPDRKSRGTAYQPSENAYMLMYRVRDTDSIETIPDDLIR